MKRKSVFTALAALQIVFSMFYAGAQNRNSGKVDFSADAMVPVTIADTNAYSLVGNVTFYHNGAVITCDSAIRYGDRRMECYKNVIINQDSTYIYGDSAEYNGLTNTVHVYSPIVKVLDGDATLYTRTFSFNTLDNIGRFGGGGILRQNEMRLESEDGYYYSNTHDMVGVGGVHLQDSTYLMATDSIRYNTEEEKAYFFENTKIWSIDGDFLMADQGSYESQAKVYDFTENAYILTEDQEIWADSIWYDALQNKALLNSNIQIFDQKNMALVFSDFASYVKADDGGQRIVLTRNPVVGSFEEGSDTLFMRADTMILVTIAPISLIDSTAVAAAFDEGVFGVEAEVAAETSESEDATSSEASETAENVGDEPTEINDEKITESDTLSDEPIYLTAKELKAIRKAELKEAKLKKREARAAQRLEVQKAKMARAIERDSIAAARYNVVDTTEVDTISTAEVIVEPVKEIVEPVVVDTASLEKRIFHAYGNVRAYRHDLQMVCDSVVSYSIDSTAHLHGTPIMWTQSNQITSENTVIYGKNQQIDYAHFTGAPIMASEVDTTHYNQIKGREIMARFRDNEVRNVDVKGNSQTYYYMVEDSTNLITGFLVAESVDITFVISERNVETITFYTEPVYTIYPMDKIPSTQSLLLSGFKWNADLRPEQQDVIDRTILEPIRDEIKEIPIPRFAIMARIDNLRERLINRDEWVDREELIPPYAIEFMQEIEQQNRGN